ncbi:glucokinase [Paenibacillus sp. J2TS4]|nr:glucokinase [Paenibacillus sp. J2TS4]
MTKEAQAVRTDVFPTEASAGREALLGKLSDLLSHYRELARRNGWSITAAGVGTAGFVDIHEGSVPFASDNLPGWSGVRLRDELEEASGLPVVVSNDAHALAVGEAWAGAGRGLTDFLCITLGTGIGGCRIVNGRPDYGHSGYAGGFGHQIIVYGGNPCTCGGSGCWESYASVTGLLRLAEEAGLSGASPERLFADARSGRADAAALIRVYIGYVAAGLFNLVYAYNPQAIIIGGAVTAQGDYLLDPIRRELNDKLMPVYRAVQIIPAELGSSAGWMGAAQLAFQSGLDR